MKTYLALTALLCSLASAVDIYDNDDQPDNDDWFDDDDLFDDDLFDDDELFADAAARDYTWDKEMTYNGFRYLYKKSIQSWWNAKLICEEQGGALLSIRDDAELAAVKEFLPDKTKKIGKRKSVTIHLGLYKEPEEPEEPEC